MNDLQTAPKPPARARRASPQVCECIPAYGAGAGILSFRHALPPCDIAVIDHALNIIGRYLLATDREVMDTPDAVKTYMQLQLAGEQTERFAALFLDAHHRVIAFEILAVGSLTQTNVYPREVVRAALAHGAAALVIGHNHPSGLTTPSRADENLTETLKSALALVDVRVLDHVIVASDCAPLSMAERGLL